MLLGFGFNRVSGEQLNKRPLTIASSHGRITFLDGKGTHPVATEAAQAMPTFSSGDKATDGVDDQKADVIPVDLTGKLFPQPESPVVTSQPETVSVVIDGGAPIIAASNGSIDINAPLWQQRLQEAANKDVSPEPAITNDKPGEVTPHEAELHALLERVKEAPVTDRPAVVQEIAKLKKETGLKGLDAQTIQAIAEEKKAQEVARKEKAKNQAGIKILQEENRIEALKKNIAAIERDIKQVDDQIAHREPQASLGRRKKNNSTDAVLVRLQAQSADLRAQAVSFEERLKDSENARQEAVNIFLSLDGSEEQIDELIRDNIAPEDKMGESVTIELSDVAQEMAATIPAAMALGAGPGLSGERTEAEMIPTPTSGVETPSQPEAEKTLDERIALARLAYVEKDVAMTNQWERLKRSFTWLEKTEDTDLVMLRDQYRTLLTQKKEEELTRIASLSEKARAQEMLELGMYFKVTEGAALASLYVEKEKETISSKLGAQLDWIGEKYNGLSLGKKALLAVGLVGSSIALGATGGAGIAVGAVAVRRFCAGLGGAVAIDAAAEKFFSGRQEKKAHTETTDFIEQEKWASSPELMKRFDTFLALENDSIDKQIDKKRTKMFFRKWSLRMGGAFGLAALSELWQAHDAVASVTPPADTLPPVLPDQIGGDMPDASVSEAAIPEATAAITETPIAPTPSIPESYTLSAPDSNQGLWGVLDKSLPAELDEAHKNQAITSLQNLIATKLEDMSPEDRAAAGFRSGDINTIYAGDTLKLDGLVSQTELQEIIDGKIIDPPAVEVDVPTALEVPEVAYGADAPNADIPQTASLEGAGGSVDRVAVASTSDTLLNQVNEGSLIDTDTDGEPVDGTAKLLGEGGIERAVYYQELENTRRSIFATNDLRFRDSILNAPKVKMADIILAAKSPGETLVENQALFGTDQITRLNRFKELAVSAYGKIAEPGSRETVADYTRRLVTLGFESPESKINIDKLARV